MKYKKFLPVVSLAALCIAAAIHYTRQDRIVCIDSGYRPVMGTFARVVATAKNEACAKEAIEAAFAEFEKVDVLMSDYKEDSEIGRVNRLAFTEAVKVSPQTFEVLRRSVEFSRLSGGALDITIGPLVMLWRQAGDANSPPTEAQLAEAGTKVGYEKLLLDANNLTVRFAVEGMRLDLGATAKGYAADKAVETMRSCGAVGGMADAGGNIRCFGAPQAGRKAWRIAVQDPAKVSDAIDDAGGYLFIFKLTEEAVATSGDYRRFVTVGGQRHSHIIEPESGLSSVGLSSVTIISPNAMDADALSTAVTVMGIDRGLELLKKLPQTEAILVTAAPEYKIIKTPNADKFIEPQ